MTRPESGSIRVRVHVASDETREQAIDRLESARKLMPDADVQAIADLHSGLFGLYDRSRTLAYSFDHDFRPKSAPETRSQTDRQPPEPGDPVPWIVKGIKPLDQNSPEAKRLNRPPRRKVDGWTELKQVFACPPPARFHPATDWKSASVSLRDQRTTNSMAYRVLQIADTEDQARPSDFVRTPLGITTKAGIPWPSMDRSNEVAPIRFARTLCKLAANDVIPFFPSEYWGHAVLIEHFHIADLNHHQMQTLDDYAQRAARACRVEIHRAGNWFEVYELPEQEPDNVY